MNTEITYKKPNAFWYGIIKGICRILTLVLFKPTYIRNELKNVKGPCVIICNHECALDFPYLFTTIKGRATFVISKAFHDSLPLQKIVEKLRFVSKQQFQTSVSDMNLMKAVVDNGNKLVVFPAGLMTENGVSTPIPHGTYRFLQYLNADVYAVKLTGTYFVNAKWRKKFRNGKTYFEAYKLFDKEQIASMEIDEIKEIVDSALMFDAYDDQEKKLAIYKNNNNIEGLEKVLYQCPHCHKEGTMKVKNKDTIYCEECGYSETADKYGFLHNNNQETKEYRHVPHWDFEIFKRLRNEIFNNPDYSISSKVDVFMIDKIKHKFRMVGHGLLSMNKEKYSFKGLIKYVEKEFEGSIKPFFILPNNQIRNSLEFQEGETIYRFILKDENQFVTKWLHVLKIFYEINYDTKIKTIPRGLNYESNI